jgi:ABC-type branched-subunit amino acid transport system substrate-binding protein
MVGRKVLWGTLASLVGVVFVMASCGGSTTSSASRAPVTIGLLAPMTGSRSDLGRGMQLGAMLAVKEVNAAGGVLGHPVRLVTQDTMADPVDAVPAAQLEINTDHVAAIVGPTSIEAGVVLPLADKANIPDLMFGGGSEFDQDTDPHFFRMSPSDSEQAQAMVYFAHLKGWNHIGLAFGASSGSQALVPSVISAAKKLHMTVDRPVTFTAGASSYRSEPQTLFASKPQVILAQFNNTTAGVVFGEVAQEGLTATPWIGTNLWYTDTWFKAVGPTVASGPVYLANSSSSGMVGVGEFLKLLKQQTGSNIPANGEEFMYDAVITWALGADQAGSWSWPQIRNGILKASNPPGTVCGDYKTCYQMIRQGKKINWDGAASTVDFNRYDNVFGPFAILHYDASGNASTVITLTPQQIEAAFK